MRVAALFIRRPASTALIMLGMLFFGLAAYGKLPVNQLPTVGVPTIRSSGKLISAEAFRDAVVACCIGAPSRLRDLGGVVDAIRALLPAREKQMPPSVRVGVFYDRSESIRESVPDVKSPLALTVLPVASGIVIFSRNPSVTAILRLALPMPVIPTFAVMFAMGVTPRQRALTLQSAYGSREVAAIYAPTNAYYVFVELQKPFQEYSAGRWPRRGSSAWSLIRTDSRPSSCCWAL